MDTKKFSIGDIVNQSWILVKPNVWVFIAALLLFYLVNFVVSLFFNGAIATSTLVFLPGQGSAGDLLASLVSIPVLIYFFFSVVLSAFFYLGFYQMGLEAADGEEASLSVFSRAFTWRKVGNLFLGNILFGLLFSIGLILLIIPGVLVYARMQYYIFFIIEEDCGPIQALRRSWDATRGHSLELVALLLVFLFINLLGLLLCGIGLLVTLPMTIVAFALVYRFFVPLAVSEQEEL